MAVPPLLAALLAPEPRPGPRPTAAAEAGPNCPRRSRRCWLRRAFASQAAAAAAATAAAAVEEDEEDEERMLKSAARREWSSCCSQARISQSYGTRVSRTRLETVIRDSSESSQMHENQVSHKRIKSSGRALESSSKNAVN